MFLCDLHCHSSGISKCCRIPYTQVIDEAKQAGIQAIVLTNHYVKENVVNSSAWIDILRSMSKRRYMATA